MVDRRTYGLQKDRNSLNMARVFIPRGLGRQAATRLVFEPFIAGGPCFEHPSLISRVAVFSRFPTEVQFLCYSHEITNLNIAMYFCPFALGPPYGLGNAIHK